MTIESIVTIRYSLKLLHQLNKSIARISENPDRIARALKDVRRDEVALAEFDKFFNFHSEVEK